MDKYKKKICLYFRLQYLSLPQQVWDSLVPPGSTRRCQTRARAQHEHQYKIKKGQLREQEQKGNLDIE